MPTRDAAQFNLVSGNRLDRLADFLAERLAQPPAGDVLTPDTVLIPQPTLRRWLQQHLALRHGIAANIDFATPSEFVWRLLRADQPALPEHSPWDRERLRWRLYALLAALPDAPGLPPAVVDHLRRAGGGTSPDSRALACDCLADALAGAFDRYQAYRRDWLDAWERGRDPDDWQAQLWRRLQATQAGAHRAALLGDWLRRFDGTGATPAGLPPRLSAFGTIHVSPDVLRLLGAVAQHVPVDFHLPTPSREYWGDVESLRERLRRDGPDALPDALADAQHDNPLLAGWGAGGRDIVAQLYSYELVAPTQETDLSQAPPRDSLLHRLQADVLERLAPAPADIAEGDLSLQVHACHSRLREVEVLHDRLRALLDADATLDPRDIAVLAPDIGAYLPLVRAVFDAVPPRDPRFIPYSLADRPRAQSHPVADLLLALLDLPQSRFTASDLRDMLGMPVVMRALTLDANALERIAAWFEGAGVRWGEDEAARERVGVGRWREHSIDFGVDRLLLGYATGDEAQAGGVAGWPELEGADADLLDRVLCVYVRLRELAAWMREPHTAAEWQWRLAEDFVALLPKTPADDAEAQARRLLQDSLEAFATDAADAGALPASLVRNALRERLAQPSPHQAWLAGGVTFAGMVPLRTVPFRAICLLGLDADAFPRREPGGDVNRLVDALAGRAPRRLGDRSVRDDDRFLFLQQLCAAGDVFYLSYCGFDPRDGSMRTPSALVSELLDAAQRYFPEGADARTHCVIEHPLQPFSPQAFGAGDPRRFSYRVEWHAPAATAVLQPEPVFLDAASPLPARVGGSQSALRDLPDRDALQRFFSHPVRAWLGERLQLRLPRDEEGSGDSEPLGGDALVRYHAADALLAQPQLGREGLRARGLLPPGKEGDGLAQQAQDIAARVAAVRDRHRGHAAARTLERRDGIAFRFGDVAGNARVLASPGKLHGKRRLRAGIDHLLLASVLGGDAHTVLVGFDGNADDGEGEVLECVFAGVDAAQAHDALQTLVALWREGLRSPLPFAVRSSAAYVDALRRKPDPFAAWCKARSDAFDPYGRTGESRDPWLQLAFRPGGLFSDFDAPVAQRFREIAEQVFALLEPRP